MKKQDSLWLQKFQDGCDLEQKLKVVFQIVQDCLSALARDALLAKAQGKVVNEADVAFKRELREQLVSMPVPKMLSDCSPLFIFLANSKHKAAEGLRIALKTQLQIDVMTYPTIDALLQSRSPCMFSAPKSSGVIYPVSLPFLILGDDSSKGDDSEEDVEMVKSSGAESPPSTFVKNK